jgi:hypothetical protein
VDIAADYGIGGQYVTRLLDRAALFRGHDLPPLAIPIISQEARLQG